MRKANPSSKNSSNCRSECPNSVIAAQPDMGRPSATTGDQRRRTEIEQCYRDPRLRRVVKRLAARRCADADDAFHAAIVRVLKYGSGGQNPADRLVACIFSITSTAARSQARAAANGFAGFTDPDDQCDHLWGRAFLPPDEEMERRLRQQAVAYILAEAADGDPVQATLLDAALDGLRGAELMRLLGLSERELATRRRRLKRTILSLCRPFIFNGQLDFSATSLT